MKDLELRDIFPKANRPLTSVSVYIDGRWLFATLTNPVKVTASLRVFRIDFPFGLHKSNSKNPAKYSVKGKPGEYVSINKQGINALVTVDEYSRLFPTPQQIPTSAPSSELLRDPNFLTKTQLESVNKDSDKVLIGDKQFTLPSTTKKSVSIVETPLGQSQVFYDTSAVAMVYDYELGKMVETEVPDKPY
jgi:hypothetical protein